MSKSELKIEEANQILRGLMKRVFNGGHFSPKEFIRHTEKSTVMVISNIDLYDPGDRELLNYYNGQIYYAYSGLEEYIITNSSDSARGETTIDADVKPSVILFVSETFEVFDGRSGDYVNSLRTNYIINQDTKILKVIFDDEFIQYVLDFVKDSAKKAELSKEVIYNINKIVDVAKKTQANVIYIADTIEPFVVDHKNELADAYPYMSRDHISVVEKQNDKGTWDIVAVSSDDTKGPTLSCTKTECALRDDTSLDKNKKRSEHVKNILVGRYISGYSLLQTGIPDLLIINGTPWAGYYGCLSSCNSFDTYYMYLTNVHSYKFKTGRGLPYITYGTTAKSFR